MAQTPKKEPKVPTTLTESIEEATYIPGKQELPCLPPAIPPEVQLKWGLALLGEEKALEYLKWLSERIEQHPQ